jgi:hypothetical protein
VKLEDEGLLDICTHPDHPNRGQIWIKKYLSVSSKAEKNVLPAEQGRLKRIQLFFGDTPKSVLSIPKVPEKTITSSLNKANFMTPRKPQSVRKGNILRQFFGERYYLFF